MDTPVSMLSSINEVFTLLTNKAVFFIQGGYEEVCLLLLETFPHLLAPLLKLIQNQDYEETKVRYKSRSFYVAPSHRTSCNAVCTNSYSLLQDSS